MVFGNPKRDRHANVSETKATREIAEMDSKQLGARGGARPLGMLLTFLRETLPPVLPLLISAEVGGSMT